MVLQVCYQSFRCNHCCSGRADHSWHPRSHPVWRAYCSCRLMLWKCSGRLEYKCFNCSPKWVSVPTNLQRRAAVPYIPVLVQRAHYPDPFQGHSVLLLAKLLRQRLLATCQIWLQRRRERRYSVVISNLNPLHTKNKRSFSKKVRNKVGCTQVKIYSRGWETICRERWPGTDSQNVKAKDDLQTQPSFMR